TAWPSSQTNSPSGSSGIAEIPTKCVEPSTSQLNSILMPSMPATTPAYMIVHKTSKSYSSKSGMSSEARISALLDTDGSTSSDAAGSSPSEVGSPAEPGALDIVAVPGPSVMDDSSVVWSPLPFDEQANSSESAKTGGKYEQDKRMRPRTWCTARAGVKRT